jgi:ubiquinone/menaquinone biosynthesis C-methylase UbiE
MGDLVVNTLREAQARHFDAHAPFTPETNGLRSSGFRYPYILKDQLIAEAMLKLPLASGDRVLDVGCGRGILLDRLTAGFRTQGFGVDISRVTLKELGAESLYSHRSVCSEGENLPFPDSSFDVAVSLDVLEHVQTAELVLTEMLRVLRPGGTILCYAVSRDNRLTLNWFLSKALDALGLDHWAWNGHSPERLVDPGRTRMYLEQMRCEIHDFRLFHAFFTLLFDVVMLILYWLAMHFPLARRRSSIDGSSLTWMVKLASSCCRVLWKPLDHMDSLWTRRGLSNGFLFVATKPQASSKFTQMP